MLSADYTPPETCAQAVDGRKEVIVIRAHIPTYLFKGVSDRAVVDGIPQEFLKFSHSLMRAHRLVKCLGITGGAQSAVARLGESRDSKHFAAKNLISRFDGRSGRDCTFGNSWYNHFADIGSRTLDSWFILSLFSAVL